MLALAWAALLLPRAGAITLSTKGPWPQTGSAKTAASPASSSKAGNPGEFLRDLFSSGADETCLPQLNAQRRKLGYDVQFDVDPKLWLTTQMKPGSRFITVGDSICGQMHTLGTPGFSCSHPRPCKGEPPFDGKWELELDKVDSKYKNKGWQHLKTFKLRDADGSVSQVEGWDVAPAVTPNVSAAPGWVAMVEKHFKEEIKPTEDDVLLLGFLGNHFHKAEGLAAFDLYAELLMKDVVSKFPGRVVVAGTTPSHYKDADLVDSDDALAAQEEADLQGSRDKYFEETKCGPAKLPSDEETPEEKYKSDIWGYNVLKHMKNERARYLDMYELLHPLWRCHRTPDGCTHWQDAVIDIQVQLVLETLGKIHA